MVDGGRARIILATLVTSAAVRENGPLLDPRSDASTNISPSAPTPKCR